MATNKMCCLAVILTVCNGAAYAQSAAGTAGIVTRQIQPASVSRLRVPDAGRQASGQSVEQIPAADRLLVHLHDTIITGEGGRVQVMLDDGSRVNLGQQSSLVLDAVNAGARRDTALQLQHGRMRLQVGQSDVPDSRLEIRTNTAACFVSRDEPADFYIEFTSPISTVVVNLGPGSIRVLKVGSGREVVLKADEAISMAVAEPSSSRAKPEELKRAKAAADFPQTAAPAVDQSAPTTLPLSPAGDTGTTGRSFKASGGITPPTLISRADPVYTKEARRAGLEGTVILRVVVEKDGTVGYAEVSRSLDPELDQKAIEAVKKWRFKPGTKDGQPIRVWAHIEVTFRLQH